MSLFILYSIGAIYCTLSHLRLCFILFEKYHTLEKVERAALEDIKLRGLD